MISMSDDTFSASSNRATLNRLRSSDFGYFLENIKSKFSNNKQIPITQISNSKRGIGGNLLFWFLDIGIYCPMRVFNHPMKVINCPMIAPNVLMNVLNDPMMVIYYAMRVVNYSMEIFIDTMRVLNCLMKVVINPMRDYNIPMKVFSYSMSLVSI